MTKNTFLILASSLCFVIASCSPIQTSVAPVVNSRGEMVVLKPKDFKVNENTKKSEMMALLENTLEPIPDSFLTDTFGLDEEQGKVAVSSLVIKPATVQQKTHSSETGVIAPLIVLESMNLPRETIDRGMPKLQRLYYKRLSSQGTMISQSQLKALPKEAN